MVSVIITAYKEAQTLRLAVEALLPQLPPGSELLIICPDEETTAVAQQYVAKHPQVRHLADAGTGKPAALNLGLQAANGEIIVLTDGDVQVAENALPPLLAPFAEEGIGAVTGQPVSTSPRHTKLGYWSHLLVAAAHEIRSKRFRQQEFLLCSGYLFAFRKALLPHVPEDALAEDAVISHRIAEQGYAIAYAQEARVFVKYPTTYADWLRQKVRSAGGYAQDYVRQSAFRMRSARLEAGQGTQFALAFARTPREFWWTVQLFAARLHLWLLVFWQVRVKHRPLTQLWQRVESTK